MRRNKSVSDLPVFGTAACGMSLVLTKWVALSGTLELLSSYGDVLREALPHTLIDRTYSFSKHLSVERDIEVASRSGVASFCKTGAGGIYHALWDLAAEADAGVEVYMDRIPIRQETVEICEVLDVDPYGLDCRGCLLMACEKPQPLCEELFSSGIEACVIGDVTDSRDRVIITGGTRRFLSPRPPERSGINLSS